MKIDFGNAAIRTSSSVGCVAAVTEIVSPSQPKLAVIQRMSISSKLTESLGRLVAETNKGAAPAEADDLENGNHSKDSRGATLFQRILASNYFQYSQSF